MSEKFERVFRDRLLAAAEVARDGEIREKVRAEFPLVSSNVHAPGSLSQMLRDAILFSVKSVDQIAKDAGVPPLLVSSFISGERDIRMAIADKLAQALGLRLTFAS